MSCAAALALSLHLFPGDWNAVHPSVRCDVGALEVGAFYNSERRVSVTAGRTFEWPDLWIEAGLATGYSYAPVIPYLRAGHDFGGGRHVWVLPTLTPDGTPGIVLGIEQRF